MCGGKSEVMDALRFQPEIGCNGLIDSKYDIGI